MKYRIAIDLNEVLRDFIRQFIDKYKQEENPGFDKEYEDVDDFDFKNIFPFLNEEGIYDADAYNTFRYVDMAYELHARAQMTERALTAIVNMWIANTLRNYGSDGGNDVEVLLIAPFEDGTTIPSTYGFLNNSGLQVRGIIFPRVSYEVWDYFDMVITANPNLIEAKPNDDKKVAVKINCPYNTECECELAFDSLGDMILDPEGKVNSIIEAGAESDSDY